MRPWTIVWLVIVLAVTGFAFLNWDVLTAPTSINLLVAETTAPLGLMLLGTLLAVGVVFLLFIVWLETTTLTRLGAERRGRPDANVLADLRRDLEQEMHALRSGTDETVRTLITRMERMEQVLYDEMERLTGQVTAQVDRLEPRVKETV